MSSYYCLMAGLPDIALDDGRGAQSVADFKAELAEVLTHADKELIGFDKDSARLLGVVESISYKITVIAPYTDAIEFSILIIILLVRPTGFLGKKRREKV